MKYEIGTIFRAEPVADFQEESIVEITDFNSTFDESSMEPEAEYEWKAYDVEGNEEVEEWTRAEQFENWAEDREMINDFPWDES